MKSLVIIPTYNEKDNIRTVIERLQALPIELDILIIDDSSP
ncbi:MAG TPA: glycosyltransferase, partial [Candidatus Marinimicrobia bacterium]|nr:glycosyltransferase [Candidatus Neomarinimicrobiota bacterium]